MTFLYRESFGSGPPLVMVPGWAMHRRVWGGLPRRLAQFYRVILMDLPGHGSSPSRPRWTLAEVAAELAGWVVEPSVWVGWSLGGQVVLELAARFPEKVCGLVLMASNPKFVASGDWPGMAPEWFAHFMEGAQADPAVALKRFLGLVSRGMARGTVRQLRRLWKELPPPGRKDLLQGLEVLRQSDPRSLLPEIAAPVTVVLGEGDALVPPEACRRLVSTLPRGRLIAVEQGGHAPFLPRPGALMARLRL